MEQLHVRKMVKAALKQQVILRYVPLIPQEKKKKKQKHSIEG